MKRKGAMMERGSGRRRWEERVQMEMGKNRKEGRVSGRERQKN